MTVSAIDETWLADRSNWVCVKKNRNNTVYQAPWRAGTAVFVKQYELSGLVARLSFNKKVKKLIAFCRGASGGLPIPELITAQTSAKNRSGFCVYEMLPGIDLRKVEWLSMAEADATTIGAAVGQLLDKLHTCGWVHGDFKFGNLLYNREAVRDEPKVYLVDIENISSPRIGRTKKRARDVARFVLNALELQAPNALLAAFWQNYRQSLSDRDAALLKRHTLSWMKMLARRHADRYGRVVDFSLLPF